jgi:hypothetical protein
MWSSTLTFPNMPRHICTELAVQDASDTLVLLLTSSRMMTGKQWLKTLRVCYRRCTANVDFTLTLQLRVCTGSICTALSRSSVPRSSPSRRASTRVCTWPSFRWKNPRTRMMGKRQGPEQTQTTANKPLPPTGSSSGQ